MFVGSARPPGAKLLWKTAAPPRVKFFFWLVVHRQCWTAARRKQHGLQDSDDCIMCAQAVEMMDHIIPGCVLSRQIWAMILTKLHFQDVQDEDVMPLWIRIRKVLPKENRRVFDSLFFLVGWTLWKERNARTFRNDVATPSELLQGIVDEANLWEMSGFRALRSLCHLL